MSPFTAAMTVREASTRTCSNYVKGMINMVKKENQPTNALSVHLKTRKHTTPQSENVMIVTLIHLKVHLELAL